MELVLPRVVLRPGGLPRRPVLRVEDTFRLVLEYLRVFFFAPCLWRWVLVVPVIFEGL